MNQERFSAFRLEDIDEYIRRIRKNLIELKEGHMTRIEYLEKLLDELESEKSKRINRLEK